MIPDSGDSCCWKCDMSVSLYVEFPPTFLWHPLTIISSVKDPQKDLEANIYTSTTFKCQQIFVMKTTVQNTLIHLQKGIWLHFIPPPLPGSDLIWNAQANRLFGTGRYREVGGLVSGVWPESSLHPQISVKSAGADMRQKKGLAKQKYNIWGKNKIITILLKEPSLPSLYMIYNDLYISLHTHSYLEFIL